jgi:hypothetical protein
MSEVTSGHKPNYIWSMLTLRCPRCRRGDMFTHPNPYGRLRLSHILDMHESCPVCHQKFELEPGFWYGTGYVSYALLIVFSGFSFIAWWIIIGISADDNRVLYWLLFNGGLIVVLQPWFMRFSRVVYLNFFVKYNKNYEHEEGRTLDL